MTITITVFHGSKIMHAWHKMKRIRPSSPLLIFSGFAHECYKCKMAALMSAKQVPEEILDEKRSTGEESIAERLRNGICSALIEGEVICKACEIIAGTLWRGHTTSIFEGAINIHIFVFTDLGNN